MALRNVIQETDMRKISTYEAAQRLRLRDRSALITIVHRHPELRPPEQLQPSGDLLWDEEDIQRVQDYLDGRMWRRKQA